jgi:serine/threonine protein phosphatase PrpC
MSDPSDPENRIRLRSSAQTNVGQVRENNEDTIHLWTGEHFVLAVVADGMGGAAAGEEASRIAVESIQSGMQLDEYDGHDALEYVDDEVIIQKLSEAIHQANRGIIRRAQYEPEMRGMGTTVTLAFVRGQEAIIAHVGDSRAYLVRGYDAGIEQITADHSFVQALVSAGHITPEQAENHPMQNVLYRVVGQGDELEVDLYHSDLMVNDCLVLCSDGLTRHVRPEEIAVIVRQKDNPGAASQKLIDLANERGGEDNISVIIIKVEDRFSAEKPTRPQLSADDTLILQDRTPVPIRPPDHNSTTNGTDTLPVPPASAPPAASSASVHDTPVPRSWHPKMEAERLRDRVNQAVELDEDDLNTSDAIDHHSTQEADDLLLHGSAIFEPDPSSPDTNNSDSDAEGYDSLTPDQ